MNVFYVLNGRKLKRYFLITIALVFSVGIIYAERDNITVFAPQQPAAIYSVPTDKKVVALTFDISWGEKRAEPILNVLKEKNIKQATFFLSSPWSQSHPEIVKKIQEAGYEIGSHGHKHDNYSKLSDEEIRKQITTAHTILSDVTGKQPNLIRLPNGDFDKRVLRIAEELQYKVIQWDTDSLDWMNIGTDKIINRVVTRAHPGDIILFHASDSVKQTHEALPIVIDQLRDKGYEFVTVSDLITQTEIDGKAVQDKTSSTFPQLDAAEFEY
ncbi:polysaccharide deacetylase family sporulation protein PdaB [Paenibacillus sp. PL91]|jgi:polysaccharide deacetylase family sporulation protein PdaB|uniref:polysaccharide deacetylase family sporulation protein PdaB n=1 Tax=Paenibacillus sp. PL91 TaxID=2729538 RepID=UPI00145F7908|nr:polysaccharide deacetylase family sporulation protein PdaB [Paenibacillus sp. PL91]MBC9204639.1 polysaccharide deacetylase family sporulation protein PdaB [Paenibacillus sp. PL91]